MSQYRSEFTQRKLIVFTFILRSDSFTVNVALMIDGLLGIVTIAVNTKLSIGYGFQKFNIAFVGFN